MLRGLLGNWIKDFPSNFRCSSIKVELLALLHGLRLAGGQSIKHLIIHMDSQVAITMVKELVGKRQSYFDIIKEYQLMLLNLK